MILAPAFGEDLVDIVVIKMSVPVMHLLSGAAIMEKRFARHEIAEIEHAARDAQI
jgi:hypothetical protein